MNSERSLKRSPVSFRLISGLICAVFMLLTLSGCTLRTPSMNKLDSLTFSANMKADANSNFGKKAAYFNGRIYYLSSELGTPGIYSMNPSGEEIRLEIPVEDIRAIHVRKDGLYYSGFAGIAQNDNGAYRQFRLFERKTGSDASVDLLKTFSYTDDLKDENVWDFFLTDNDICAITFVDVYGYPPGPRFSEVSFRNLSAVSLSEYTILADEESVPPSFSNQSKISLSTLDGLYFSSGEFSTHTFRQQQSRSTVHQIGYLDSVQKQTFSSIDRYFFNVGPYHNLSGRNFCRIHGRDIIFFSEIGLESYNLDTKKFAEIVAFKVPESIYQSIDCGDSILVFTQQLRGSYLLDQIASGLFHQNRALAETLYRLDPETCDYVRLLRVGHNNAFLYADAKIAVTGGGKTISVYDISGDKTVLQRRIKIGHNVVDLANKVDTAGGWLFLYQFNEKTQRDELIEKVYFGS